MNLRSLIESRVSLSSFGPIYDSLLCYLYAVVRRRRRHRTLTSRTWVRRNLQRPRLRLGKSRTIGHSRKSSSANSRPASSSWNNWSNKMKRGPSYCPSIPNNFRPTRKLLRRLWTSVRSRKNSRIARKFCFLFFCIGRLWRMDRCQILGNVSEPNVCIFYGEPWKWN